MISAWTDNLKTEEEKIQFRNQILGAKPVLKRLQEMIKQEEDALERTELNSKIYDLPNWDYRQADINGCRRFARTVKTLITIDQ